MGKPPTSRNKNRSLLLERQLALNQEYACKKKQLNGALYKFWHNNLERDTKKEPKEVNGTSVYKSWPFNVWLEKLQKKGIIIIPCINAANFRICGVGSTYF